MKYRKLKNLFFVLLICMGLTACGGEEAVEHDWNDDSYREDDSSWGDNSYWDDNAYSDSDDDAGNAGGNTTQTENSDVTKTPTTTEIGIGNTPAAMLTGGRFVYRNNILYMANGNYIYTRDTEGNVSELVYSTEGNIGYLNICGDYIYYMTQVDRSYFGGGKSDRKIYRKCLINTNPSELVVSGVIDDGMGFGIKTGVLYCTMTGTTFETKKEPGLGKVNLTDLQIESWEQGARFMAVSENAVFQVNADGEFVCKHWGGEYSLGNLGNSRYAFSDLPSHQANWSFTIEKDTFYYVDVEAFDTAHIVKVSPSGTEAICDLGEVGADYATSLYAIDGNLFLNIGTFEYKNGFESPSNRYYLEVMTVKMGKNGSLYDFSQISKNAEPLYHFSEDNILLYQVGREVNWYNYYNLYTGIDLDWMTFPGGMKETGGELLTNVKGGPSELVDPDGMWFSVFTE